MLIVVFFTALVLAAIVGAFSYARVRRPAADQRRQESERPPVIPPS